MAVGTMKIGVFGSAAEAWATWKENASQEEITSAARTALVAISDIKTRGECELGQLMGVGMALLSRAEEIVQSLETTGVVEG